MHAANNSDYSSPSVVNSQPEAAEGLFVLELEERLEMAGDPQVVVVVRCN